MYVANFKSTLTQFESSPLWGWHFLVPNDVVLNFVDGKDRRVICTINEQIKFHCAIMPNKDTSFIMLNQGLVKKLHLPPNGEIEVSLVKDLSEYGMPMPEEFREVLDQEPDADKYFHNLTPGKQRTLLYIVGKVKSSENRIKKSLVIVDHLTSNNGAIDFKLLNEAFKEYNKM